MIEWTEEEKKEIKEILKKYEELGKKINLLIKEAEKGFNQNENRNN